ncbi:MAG: small ribosomal subunit Rsm22 family protein [Bilophila sp.]
MCRPLFTPFDALSRAALELLPKALDKVMPLSRAHRADLPDAVRELSALLTHERSELGRSYWSSPRFVSAYLRYFLPWNLVRLVRLLPGLDLAPPQEGTDENPIMVADLGSGPLTLPLALWLSRPDWRATPLTLVCVDTVPRPMELGRSLLEAVAALTGEPLLWQIRLVRAPLMRAFRELRKPHLIMAGNVLNELRDKTDARIDERMAELSLALNRSLHPQGRALFVEPGTRLGGTLTATLRETALEEGFTPLAPCPHSGPCPLIGQRERRWCHANQDAGGPVWLANLARDARLAKDSLSLSFMLLQPSVDEELTENADRVPSASVKPVFPTLQSGGLVARILSDAFSVPGMGFARYACTEEGFALIPAAGDIPSGALVACRHLDPPRKDAKSGAIELLWQAE